VAGFRHPTGAGIGWETARRFAGEGARVAIFELDPEAAKAIAATIDADGGEALPLTVDVTDEQAVGAAVAHVLDTWGRLDVLVNNAGHGDPRFVKDMTVDEWDPDACTATSATGLPSSTSRRSTLPTGTTNIRSESHNAGLHQTQGASTRTIAEPDRDPLTRRQNDHQPMKITPTYPTRTAPNGHQPSPRGSEVWSKT
jgi:NAD(P)-dependent dehydrogenase (short-subunit alcohol dehydrogenase family)